MLTLDWRAIKIFLMGWGIGAFFWLPLTILLMRVMAQMGVAQNKMAKALSFIPIPTPTWAHRISAWLREFIYGG